MKKFIIFLIFTLLICNTSYANEIIYSCKFPKGFETFDAQYKFDLETKDLTGIGDFNGNMIEVADYKAELLESLGEFILGYGVNGFTTDNGFENEISFGIKYELGSTAYFFINKSEKTLIVQVFNAFSPAEEVILNKKKFDKWGENMKNSKDSSHKVMVSIVKYATENFSEKYLGAVKGNCK